MAWSNRSIDRADRLVLKGKRNERNLGGWIERLECLGSLSAEVAGMELIERLRVTVEKKALLCQKELGRLFIS